MGSEVLQLKPSFLAGRIHLKSSDSHLILFERLLLVQVNDVRQQQSDVQAVVGAATAHRAQNVEPGRERVSRCLVKNAIGSSGWNPKAHCRQLDVNSAGIVGDVDDFALLSHLKAADLENNGQREEGAVLQLKAGTSFLLVFGDRRADRLTGERTGDR
jgi:hypothetical protein